MRVGVYLICALIVTGITVIGCNNKNRVHREYYDDGKLKAEFEMKDVVRHGVSKFYDREGILLEEIHWKHGLEHGDVLGYFPDGRISERHNMVKGRHTGKSELFYPNGAIAEERMFDSLGRLIDVRSYRESGERNYDKTYPIAHFTKDSVQIGAEVGFFTKLVNADPTRYKEGVLIVTSRLTENRNPVDTLFRISSTNELGFRYTYRSYTTGVNSVIGLLIFQIPTDSGKVYSRFTFSARHYVSPE